jgi:uncharacterized protein (DUF2236 family)
MDPRRDLRRKIRLDLELLGGRHDEPEFYDGPAGDPGLAGGPTSISWELNGDYPSVLAGGLAAIVMEVLHPSVMAGVFTRSSYETQPTRRAIATLGYVLRTTFGNTEAATELIGRVKRIHSNINGTRPDGVPYRALDPELLAWVHTCIPWAIMESFSRHRRPLSTAERDRYLGEQAPIGLMGGAEWVPTTMAELDEYVERMRPLLSMNEQLRQFIAFLVGERTPGPPVSAARRRHARLNLNGSMTLMPTWARQLTGTHVGGPVQRALLDRSTRAQTALVRWAYPEPPCVAMAQARATGSPQPAEAATAGSAVGTAS